MKIETGRLALRPFKFLDFREVHEYSSNPDVVKYVAWGPSSFFDTIRFLLKAKLDILRKNKSSVNLAVILKGQNQLIGGCNLRLVEDGVPKWNIGFCINPKFWNKGYATEAGKALLSYAEDSLHAGLIMATCHPNNKASLALLQKLGFSIVA